MGRPFKCPYCSSSDTTGKGVRMTKTMGVRRSRRCKACRRKFTPKNQQAADAVPTADAPVTEIPARPEATTLSDDVAAGPGGEDIEGDHPAGV